MADDRLPDARWSSLLWRDLLPPEDRHGMPGLPRLLLSVAGAYKEKKEAIHKEAATIVHELLIGN